MSIGGKRKGAGRKPLPKGENRRKGTITLKDADWQYLTDKGPSQAKAVERLIRNDRGGK